MAANPHSERPSDEANRKQLAIAQREGAAYQEGLRVMATEIADTGGIQQAGDYIVGFAQERAEGMYHLRGEGRLMSCRPACRWGWPHRTGRNSRSDSSCTIRSQWWRG